MNQHPLHSRSEHEVLWFQRRSFLRAAALWTSLGGSLGAQAQTRSNIVTLVGDAQVNGSRLQPDQTIRNGDDLLTGPGASLVFVMGDSAFHLRQNSRLSVVGDTGGAVVNALRLLTGGVVSVWGKGPQRKISTPTMTAGIRGTGVYAEVFPDQDNRSYLCTCYGMVDLEASTERKLVEADYHVAYWGEPTPRDGVLLTPAPLLNHTDEELEYLAQLVNQRTTWQITGRKGAKDGSSYGTYGGTGSSDPSGYGKSTP
jgi:hypothetical protein